MMNLLNFFSLSKNIGIDFGSSRTRIFVPGKGIVFDEPSIIAFTSADKKEFVGLGHEVREMLGRVGKKRYTYKIIERGVINDENIANIYLENAFKYCDGIYRIFRNDILVGTPTKSTSMQDRSFRQVCKRSGGRDIVLEQNTILSSLVVGTNKEDFRGNMIADIGAELTEVAVISLGGIANSKTIKLGGSDIDNSIVNYIKDVFRVEISLESAKKLKETIGSCLYSRNPEYAKVKGISLKTELPQEIEINSNDIQEAIEDDVCKVINAIGGVFQGIAPELTADIIARGVVLVGGTSKLKGIAEKIEKDVNVPVRILEKPEHSVIKGIARSIQTGHLDNHKRIISSL